MSDAKPTASAMERAMQALRGMDNMDPRLFDYEKSVHRLALMFDEAHRAGRVAGLREAAELLQPHKPNCRKWECANCTRASAVLALAGEERGG